MKKSPLRRLIELYTMKISFAGNVQEVDQLLRDYLEDALHLDLEEDDMPPKHSVLLRQ